MLCSRGVWRDVLIIDSSRVLHTPCLVVGSVFFLLTREQVKLWRLHLRFDSAFEGDVFMFRLHVK